MGVHPFQYDTVILFEEKYKAYFQFVNFALLICFFSFCLPHRAPLEDGMTTGIGCRGI